MDEYSTPEFRTKLNWEEDKFIISFDSYQWKVEIRSK